MSVKIIKIVRTLIISKMLNTYVVKYRCASLFSVIYTALIDISLTENIIPGFLPAFVFFLQFHPDSGNECMLYDIC